MRAPAAEVLGAWDVIQWNDADGDGWMAERDRDYLPRVFLDLRAEHPGVAEAYDNLGDACRRAGPLNEREQRLVKLGIAVGLSSEGAVRSHVRRGLDEGLTRAELLHAIVVAVPTAGFPATAAAYPRFRSYSPPNAPDRASRSTRWASGWVHEAVPHRYQ